VDVVGLRLGDPVFQVVHQLHVWVRPQIRVPALRRLLLQKQLFFFCVLIGSAVLNWSYFTLIMNCRLLKCGLLRPCKLLRLCGLQVLCGLLLLYGLLRPCGLLQLCGLPLLWLCGRLGGQVVWSGHVVDLQLRVDSFVGGLLRRLARLS
jgi:hypothetical protein